MAKITPTIVDRRIVAVGNLKLETGRFTHENTAGDETELVTKLGRLVFFDMKHSQAAGANQEGIVFINTTLGASDALPSADAENPKNGTVAIDGSTYTDNNNYTYEAWGFG